MWYGNFIVFVIFVVVDETISGKVEKILVHVPRYMLVFEASCEVVLC